MPQRKGRGPTDSDEDQALKQRVDAMLDPNQAEQPPAVPSPSVPGKDQPPPLDIFKDMPQQAQSGGSKTAPEVSGNLLQEIGASAAEPETSVEPEGSTEAEEQTKPGSAAPGPSDATSELDNAETDNAVDDIAAREADTMLAVQDAVGRKKSQPDNGPGWKDKLRRLLTNKWTWISLAVILALLFAIPYTRYKLLGIFIKEPVTVTVTDSKTMTPVSSATVTVAGVTAKTNGNGKVLLKTAPGKTKLTVSKRYYKTYSTPYSVTLKSSTTSLQLVATGRQVPVTVVNTITGKPLANASIKVLNTAAKTDSHGKAVIVLPAGAASDKGLVQLDGYNVAKVTVQVTSGVVPGNTFKITPAGHIYFLSNASGTIDVVKANLDGSGRQTAVAGTGTETAATTSLLATRDWRYLVLKARRSGAQPALYLIDTSNDKLTAFDTTNSDFNLIGWSGHNFMYDLTSNTTPQSQNGHEAIKSYDADHLQLNQLDQSQAESNTTSYAYQDFLNFYVLNNQLAYNTMWATSSGYDISNKNDTVRAVQPNGLNKKDYQTFPATGVNYILATLYQPQTIYYAVNTAGKTTYYNFANQAVDTVNIDQAVFSKGYPTYLISPSGSQTFWTETQAAQNNLFIGNASAQQPKQIASLSPYSPYGWFSDKYVLVSKGNSNLYVMSAGGLAPGQQPVKVSDYFQPTQVYSNYGYGYGGL